MKPSTMLTAGSRYVNLSRDWIQPLHCAQNFASYHESANPSRQGLQVVYYADCRYSAKSKLCRLHKSNAPFGAAMERMSIVDPKSKLKKKEKQDPTPKSKILTSVWICSFRCAYKFLNGISGAAPCIVWKLGARGTEIARNCLVLKTLTRKILKTGWEN